MWPILLDAAELTRAACGGDARRSDLAVALSSDSFVIIALQRTRELSRALHVPLVNHALRFAQSALFGIEIDRDVTLGRGVYFVHTHAIVIGGDSKIGSRVRFYGCNTIGTAKDNGYPVIGDDVWIGAGARILGPVRVGPRARIGANAVVLTDLPADSVAVGAPARVLRRLADRARSSANGAVRQEQRN